MFSCILDQEADTERDFFSHKAVYEVCAVIEDVFFGWMI